MMSPLENLHYAIGELAYVMARADGEVQKEERKKFLDIISSELSGSEGSEKTGEIIFRLMDKREQFDGTATYEMAMNTLRSNSHYLSPALKEKFIRLLERVAEAYPPVTSEENAVLKRFKTDIQPINGDPVFYGSDRA